MKKKLSGLILVATVFVVGLNLNLKTSENDALDSVFVDNIEALAEGELGGGCQEEGSLDCPTAYKKVRYW